MPSLTSVQPAARTPAPEWQRQLAAAVRDLAELLRRLDLAPEQVDVSPAAAAQFPVLVPEDYLARMRPGDASDPLLRQVLPLRAEERAVPGFSTDPLAEAAVLRGPGQLHKYHGRLLLVGTGACAVHCRYCFRRHFPYGEQQASRGDWSEALATLRDDAGLSELILSGGDPLTLSDRRLRSLLGRLHEIPHLRRLRIHTRLPVVLPARVDDGLLATLAVSPVPVTIVVHSNHAREISPTVEAAMRRLHAAGALLLNQAVLLRGVNDSLSAQQELWERLFEARVLPYYLHLLDLVDGAAHFEVGEDEARRLIRDMRARMPGYLVPRLAREEPGADGKTVLA